MATLTWHDGRGRRGGGKAGNTNGTQGPNTTSQICLVAVILIAFRSGCGPKTSGTRSADKKQRRKGKEKNETKRNGCRDNCKGAT